MAEGIAAALKLDVRTGLPDELRVLIDRYPRWSWGSINPVGELGRFWFDRHNALRQSSDMLVTAVGDLREGIVEAGTFAPWFARRINHFLGDLHGHHQIEDMHYFPVFAAADARLSHGFALLEDDHHLIHEALERNARAARAFHEALIGKSDKFAFLRDAYALEAESLLKGLLRHLEDEEDLIIPLLMEQGEDKFT